MCTAKRTLGVMCVLLFLSATPNVTAQTTPCVSTHCVFLPSMMNAVTGPLQILSYRLISQRDQLPLLAGKLSNTLSKNIYQVTLLATHHSSEHGTTTVSQTFDVIFANETVAFRLRPDSPSGFYDFTVTSWTDKSDRVYRHATVTIQKVQESFPLSVVYGTVQNENTRTLHGLRVEFNELYPGFTLDGPAPDVLPPHAKVAFSFYPEHILTASPSVRAYGYLTK